MARDSPGEWVPYTREPQEIDGKLYQPPISAPGPSPNPHQLTSSLVHQLTKKHFLREVLFYMEKWKRKGESLDREGHE